MNDIEDFETVQKFATHEREPFFAIARNYFCPGMITLDVGAGDGNFARFIGDENIYLVDGNPATVEHLKKQFKNAYSWKAQERLPFDNHFFDLIHCSHLVEHLQPSELYTLMIDFDRCLRPGGFLIISTPLLWEGFYDDLSHIKPYSPHIFENYFGSRVSASRTRGQITSGYKVAELRYRYRVVPIPYISVTWANKFLKKLAFRLSEFLRRLRFGYYESTGYTLVMRKPESSASSK